MSDDPEPEYVESPSGPGWAVRSTGQGDEDGDRRDPGDTPTIVTPPPAAGAPPAPRRALLDAEGNLWLCQDDGKVTFGAHSSTEDYVRRGYGPVREMLLVPAESPRGGTKLDLDAIERRAQRVANSRRHWANERGLDDNPDALWGLRGAKELAVDDVPALVRELRAALAAALADRARLRWFLDTNRTELELRATNQWQAGVIGDLRQELEQLRRRLAAAEQEVSSFQDWSNRLTTHIPEEYDGDEAQEAIISRWVEDMVETLRRVRAVCDEAERQATRWEQPLPVPEWVGQVRAALAGEEADHG